LIGDREPNVLSGLGGNDVIDGRAGNDAIRGGDGFDAVSYAGSASGVTVNLVNCDPGCSAGTATGDGSDSIDSAVEDVVGSSFADTLTGNTSVNVLGGGAGNDAFDGGAGVDTATFSASVSGVSLNLTAARLSVRAVTRSTRPRTSSARIWRTVSPATVGPTAWTASVATT
jgi:Ca2+-binding RTX toxin-like protein